MIIKIKRWKDVLTLIRSSHRRIKRKICRQKKISDKDEEHDDAFNKDEVHTKPSVKYLYDRSKNNEHQKLYDICRKNHLMTNFQWHNYETWNEMKVDWIKLRLTGSENYVQFVFKMFDKEWINSNLKVIYIKFSWLNMC